MGPCNELRRGKGLFGVGVWLGCVVVVVRRLDHFSNKNGKKSKKRKNCEKKR